MTRISSLPRRDWADGAEEIADRLTDQLRTPYGAMSLRPIQAVSLLEAAERRGLFCNAGVGLGKTIVSFLLPTILGARRPLLLLPAQRKRPTEDTFRDLAKHWPAPAYYRIESYSMLGTAKNADVLTAYAPDLIVADEAQALKHLHKSAGARRVRRYFESFPETLFCALSATLTEGSILDYWHLIDWALKQGSPLPRERALAEVWAAALDDAPTERLDDLTALQADLGKVATIREAREAFRDRLLSTPGVIVSTEGFRDTALTFTPIVLAPPAELAGPFEDLRSVWIAPDGWPMADARFEVWACARQLSRGFFYRHDPWPPDDWFEARRVWCKAVRTVIENSESFDSEHQIALACEAQELGDDLIEDYLDWREIEPTFEINKVATWISEFALVAAIEWGRRQNAPAIIWTEHEAFSTELCRRTGWPYYGAEGLNAATGEHIEASRSGCVIASIKACGEGTNLQHHFARNLITSPMTTSRLWEQVPGRTHRSGQREPVTVDYFVTSREDLNAVAKAIARAGFAQTTMRTPQKILDWGLDLPQTYPDPDHPIWSQTQGEK